MPIDLAIFSSIVTDYAVVLEMYAVLLESEEQCLLLSLISFQK